MTFKEGNVSGIMHKPTNTTTPKTCRYHKSHMSAESHQIKCASRYVVLSGPQQSIQCLGLGSSAYTISTQSLAFKKTLHSHLAVICSILVICLHSINQVDLINQSTDFLKETQCLHNCSMHLSVELSFLFVMRSTPSLHFSTGPSSRATQSPKIQSEGPMDQVIPKDCSKPPYNHYLIPTSLVCSNITAYGCARYTQQHCCHAS